MATSMISTNIPEVKKAFKKQEDQLENLERLEDNNDIEVNYNGTVKIYDFKECQAEVCVRDVFQMFQNWAVMNAEKGEYSKYSAAEVQVHIAGKPYQFIVEKDQWSQELVIDNNCSNIRRVTLKYQHLFDAVKGEKKFTIQKMAEFMLEASVVRVNDDKTYKDWKIDFPFIDNRVTGMVKGFTMWELLCDIMAIAQVAEAARPDPKFFDKWMRAARNFNNVPSNPDHRLIRYFQHLKQEGIERNSDFTGRVPYADTVFRKMLARIQADKTLEIENLQEEFETKFPMCKSIENPPKILDTKFTASPVNLGRCHILYDEWIRDKKLRSIV